MLIVSEHERPIYTPILFACAYIHMTIHKMSNHKKQAHTLRRYFLLSWTTAGSKNEKKTAITPISAYSP